MEAGKVLALDFGSKRIGVAISDESRKFSFPRDFLNAQKKEIWLKDLGTLLEGEAVQLIVVGIPLNQYGEEGEDAANVRKLIALVKGKFTVPVVEWDERFTTHQAERILLEADVSREKRKTVIDGMAAGIILQSYLDSLRFQDANRDSLEESNDE